MTDTPRTGLEFVDAGTTDIDQPVNNNALALDAVVGMNVVSATTTAEPTLTSPTDDGKVYILPAGRTGTNWGAQAVGTIAQFYSGTWYFYAPWAGLQARAADTGIRYQYTTSWAVWATADAQSALAGTGGTTGWLRGDGTVSASVTAPVLVNVAFSFAAKLNATDFPVLRVNRGTDGAGQRFDAYIATGGGNAAFQSFNDASGVPLPFFINPDKGNVALFGAGSFGSGEEVLFIANATTVPTTNPSGGGILYVDGGSAKARTPGGNVVTFAPNTAPSVTGSRGGNAALASLLTTLAAAGIIEDNTTA